MVCCLSLSILVGCGGEEAPKTQVPEGANAELDTNEMKSKLGEEMYERTRDIFYSMPSPLELQSIVEQAGGYFRADLLHDPKLSAQYQGTEKLSRVLGIYGTDMSYATVYKQQQESILHLAASQRVAKAMGITDPFQGHLIDRANASMSNKDSMMLIVSEMYWEMNSQLQEEERNALGLVVLAAGWVEGVYLGSQILDEKEPQPAIAEVLVEQRFIADQIDKMLNDYQEDPLVAGMQKEVRPLLEAFLALPLNETAATVRKENGKTVIGGKQEITYTIEDLNTIRSLAKALREKFIAL
jgi:hypothetical protein